MIKKTGEVIIKRDGIQIKNFVVSNNFDIDEILEWTQLRLENEKYHLKYGGIFEKIPSEDYL